MAGKMTRQEFLRRLFKPVKNMTQETPQEPDYLSMLPSDFSHTLLVEEVIRLGEDPEKLTYNQMAGLVLGAMNE